jgi:hypothetical protein
MERRRNMKRERKTILAVCAVLFVYAILTAAITGCSGCSGFSGCSEKVKNRGDIKCYRVCILPMRQMQYQKMERHGVYRTEDEEDFSPGQKYMRS